MSKVNLLWEKARRAGLAEGKLERLYSKLKVQDKDELTMKKLKTEGGDKDGIKDAEVRRKFALIMEEFGLMGGDVVQDKEVEPTKALFRDKKLTRLWEKAEKSGLSSEELTALQEEFQHHQRKTNITCCSRWPGRMMARGSMTSKESWTWTSLTSGTPMSTIRRAKLSRETMKGFIDLQQISLWRVLSMSLRLLVCGSSP